MKRCVATLQDGTQIELPEEINWRFEHAGFSITFGTGTEVDKVIWHLFDDIIPPFAIRVYEGDELVDSGLYRVEEYVPGGSVTFAYFKRGSDLPEA